MLTVFALLVAAGLFIGVLGEFSEQRRLSRMARNFKSGGRS